MPRSKVITATIQGGGSGSGISKWKGWQVCPNRAFLDEEAQEKGKPTSHESPETLIGTATHAFLEIYFRGGIKRRGYNTAAVQFMQAAGGPWDVPSMVQAEASRLFQAYRVKFAPDFFGRIPKGGVERHLTLPMGKKRPKWAPASMPLTAQIDLDVTVNKASAGRIQRAFQLPVTEGKYLVDHKTAGNDYRNAGQIYALEPQFPFYMMMYSAITGRQPRGLIVNVLIKTSKPKFVAYLVPFPNKETQAMVADLLRQAWRNYCSEEHECTQTACGAWGRPCGWYEKGMCERS